MKKVVNISPTCYYSRQHFQAVPLYFQNNFCSLENEITITQKRFRVFDSRTTNAGTEKTNFKNEQSLNIKVNLQYEAKT